MCSKHYHAAYRTENIDKVRVQKTRRYHADPETMREKHARWRAGNLEKIKESSKRWKAENAEKVRKADKLRSLRLKGFSEDGYALALAVQRNRCAICKTLFSELETREVHADHDHRTNEPRGVLCRHCNVGLGIFKDSPNLLNAAAEYLARPTMKGITMLEPKVEELKTAVEQNTAVLRELIAALTAAGALQTAQASAAAHSSPAVKAVVAAQKAADAKKSEKVATATDVTPAAETAPSASGEQSAPTGESSSSEPTGEMQPWAEKTAAKFAELKDATADLDNVRKAVLGINSLIGREQATAVLGRFGVQAVTPKDNKKGLDESQYADFFVLCLEVLSGKVDATASMVSE
jgi:hypothetical protein